MQPSRTNQLIIAAAQRLGVMAQPIASEPSDFFLRLSRPGGPSALISKTRSPWLTEVAQTLANNKFISRELLGRGGLPVQSGVLLDDANDPRVDPAARARAEAFLAEHGRVVVKPNWGNRGVGIVTDVRTLDQLLAAYAFAREIDRDEEVVLEPYVAGVNVRVAVIGGRYAAAAEIARPALNGDGQRSVAELIAALNLDPRRGRWDQPSLVALDQIDDEMVADLLEVHGLELDSVLAVGERIELCFEELEVIDRTDQLHPQWVTVALAGARDLGIDVAGVDLRGTADDLYTRGPSWDREGRLETDARLLEVNALPALHLHALPTVGQPRPVFEAFVAYCLQLPGAPPPGAAVRV